MYGRAKGENFVKRTIYWREKGELQNDGIDDPEKEGSFSKLAYKGVKMKRVCVTGVPNDRLREHVIAKSFERRT